MRSLVLLLAFVAARPAASEIVVATQVIRANTVISGAMISVKQGDLPGVFSDPNDVIGLEARSSIYPGRPIQTGSIGAPALIERNQIVPLVYTTNGLTISTEGRALSRAGAGERARVMNLSSRTTVYGTVLPDGSIRVSN